MIPEGGGGWGWHKFFDKQGKAAEYLSAMVGCRFGSSAAMVKKDGKGEGLRLGLVSKGSRPSYAEVLRSNAVSVVGGRQPKMRAPLAELCAFDLLPVLSSAVLEDPRRAMDCSFLEPIPVAPMDMGISLCPLCKKRSPAHHSARGKVASKKGFNLNSNLHTWRKLLIGFKLVLGEWWGSFWVRSQVPVWASKTKVSI